MKNLGTPLALLLATVLGACVSDSTAPIDTGGTRVQFAVSGPAAISAAETDALGEAFDRVDEYSVSIVDAVTLEAIADAVIPIGPSGEFHTLDVAVPDEALGRTVTISLIAFGAGQELYRSTLTIELTEATQSLPVELVVRYTGPGIRGRIVDESGDGVAGVQVDLFQDLSEVASVITEDDGTYLFVDLPAGPTPFVVEPLAPEGLYICPFFREVTLATTDDAIIADFAVQSEICGTSVLVLSGGDFDDTGVVASLLASNPDLETATFFHVSELPGAALLNQYDVVLLFMNGLFDQSAALGDQIADYVSVGGNVVVASFYWQGRSDSGLGSVGWGALEAIDPFTSLGGANYSPGALGTVVSHPLTTDLASLDASTFWGGVALGSGAMTVASWEDGTPLVGYRILGGGQRIVGVSLFPNVGPAATGDVLLLFDNAVTWAGAAGGPAPVEGR